MESMITRILFPLAEEDEYKEHFLSGYKNSYCYELTVSRKLILVPNVCTELIWNMESGAVQCLQHTEKALEIDVVGKRIFGIHMDCRYQCQYNKDEFSRLLQEMIWQKGFRERVVFCDKYLQNYINISKVHPFLEHCIERIEQSGGKAPVEMTASELGYSPRHMERLFRDAFSCGPKRFCRYVRLVSAISNMQRFPENNIESLIEHMGYADQSHFQREFKLFMGMTPKQFSREYLESNVKID